MFQPSSSELAFLKATTSTYQISGCFGQPGTEGQVYKAELVNLNTHAVWASGTAVTEQAALSNAVANATAKADPQVIREAKEAEADFIEIKQTGKKRRKPKPTDDDSPPDNGED
jgi:hypothetical protein